MLEKIYTLQSIVFLMDLLDIRAMKLLKWKSRQKLMFEFTKSTDIITNKSKKDCILHV
jgi:hypothetical protein